MSTRPATTSHRAPSTEHVRDTRDAPAGIEPACGPCRCCGKRARYPRRRLTQCRRRVSHNTLEAADGAHRLHRQPCPCSRPRHHE